MKIYLVESGIEVEAETNARRKSELIIKAIHIKILLKFSFIGGREISLRRGRLEKQKRNE